MWPIKRFNIYKPPVYQRVNHKNKEFLKDYLLELEMDGRAKSTIKAYRSDLRAFFCWLCKNGNPYILKCRKRVFRRFFLCMTEHHLSHNRINRMQSSIRNLLQFAVNDDDEYRDYQINIMDKIPTLKKQAVRKIYFLSDDEITKMLSYLIRHKQYEIALYLSLSYDSAGRRREVSEVKKDGFLKHRETNLLTGKEGKHFRLMYGDRTRRIAKLYFKQRGKDNVGSLWITRDGNAASYQELYYWCRYLRVVLKRVTGKTVKFNPHSIRHSSLQAYSDGTHEMLRENHLKKLPLRLLSKIGHHSSVSTTENYLKDNDEEKLKSIFNL